MNKYIFLWLFSVIIAAFSQVLLKVAANREYESKLREYLNPLVITAYGIFFLSWALTTWALRHVAYAKNSPVIEATSYIWGPLFGVLLLKEKISKRRLLGMAIILVGILVFCL